MDSKTRVLILQRILKVKGLLFDDERSMDDKNIEWKRIADYAQRELGVRGRDYKFFKGPFMYNCKNSLGVSLT